MEHIDYNQNDVAKFIPLFQHKQGGEKRDVIMMAQGQEQGVVLCDLGNKFVTWSIYRHDHWMYTNHGHYYPYGFAEKVTFSAGEINEDKAEAFEEAKVNFFDRAKSI